MKKLFVLLFVVTFLMSCNSKSKRPQTAVETGTEFIRATLDGDFKTAEPLLLNDEQNASMFQSYKTYYQRLPAYKKSAYRKASYTINTLTEPNDSTSIINYSNSYMQQAMNIKVIRRDNVWIVDFKYTSTESSANN